MSKQKQGIRHSLLRGLQKTPGSILVFNILLFAALATALFGVSNAGDEDDISKPLLASSLLSAAAIFAAASIQGCLRYVALAAAVTYTIFSLYGAYIFLPGW